MSASMVAEVDPIDLEDLEPGDIGFGPIGGLLGVLVGIGQVLLGDESRFRHVFVVTRASEVRARDAAGRPTDITWPQCVEAMPSGARLYSLAERWDQSYVYVRLEGFSREQRAQVARRALEMVGTPYGFSDYLALALKHWGIRSRILDRWISREDDRGYPRRAICSQLADKALSLAGICVFRDGRLSQDVIPGALLYQLLRNGGRAFWPQ